MKILTKLEDTYKNLQTGIISSEEASKLLLSETIQGEIQWYLKNKEKKEKYFEQSDIMKLGYILKIANFIYTYSGLETGITDSDYDILISLYQDLSHDYSFTEENKTGDEKEHHKYPVLRGTLDKVYSLGDQDIYQKVNDHRETLDQWIKRTEEVLYQKTGKKYHLNNELVYCFPKWDGCSCVFEFDEHGNVSRALTRGYTKLNIAKNITSHVKNVTDGNYVHGLKTEVMVRNEDVQTFIERMKKDYKQSRSVASAIINSDKTNDNDDLLVVKKLRVIKEDQVIEDLSDDVFNDPYIRCYLKDRDQILKFANGHRVIDGLRCDGVVIRFINPEIIQLLGREDDKNKFEVAYKFTEEYAYTRVLGIEFQIGMFGRLTPVVKFEPVVLKGNTVKSASLGSMAIYRKLQLSKGDKIKILYDITPYVTLDNSCEVSLHDVIVEPRYCPSCGHLLSKNGDLVTCENKNCTWVMKGRILNYLVKMKIDGIGFSTVSKFFDAGYLQTIPDLYELKKHRKALCELDGFGKDSIDKILASIEKSRGEVLDFTLFGSLGIDSCSQKTFERIFKLYTFEELLEFAKEKNPEYLTLVDGIGEKKAKKILQGIRESKEMIKRMLTIMQVVHPEYKDRIFKVCFTKVRDEDAERFVEAMGGEVSDNVTKDTSFVVVPSLSINSTKIEKAKKYEIPLVVIDDLESYINKKYRK